MKIPMTDLKVQYESIKNKIDDAIRGVINESSFILGKQLTDFESEIASYFKVKYALGVGSGTDALVLSLAALDIKKGDEVITTPFTFIATAEAIARVGARPVFCDIDYETYNINPGEIESKITSRTKAIIPVHLYGLPAQMDEIMVIANKHKLRVVEDCAQSFGSEYLPAGRQGKNKKVGSIGDCGCLSFFPAKTLGCYGDGGMVVTDDEQIFNNIKLLRNHGSSQKYYYIRHGFNSRLDTIQAAVLQVKFQYIDKWIDKRIENAKYYNSVLSGVEGVVTPAISQEAKHTFNYYNIRIKKNRDKVQLALKENNIAYAVYYPMCLHLQEVYKESGYKRGDFPVAEQAEGEVLALPMYPELDKEQIEKIAKIIKLCQEST